MTMQSELSFEPKRLQIVIVGVIALAIAIAATVTKAQTANTIDEPTTENVFYMVSTDGTQHPLESVVGKTDAATMTFSVQGEHSAVRFPDYTDFKFLVRLPANSGAQLQQYVGTQGQRVVIAQKTGNKIILTTGKTIGINTAHVGKSSYLFTPWTHLSAGEYCLLIKGISGNVSCFGVDAASGAARTTSAQAQAQDQPQVQSHSSGAQAMTNADVIKLISAGLSPEVVSSSIRQASDHAFDLSIDGLIALKQKKVPDSVISAMQSYSGSASSAATPAAPSTPSVQAQNSAPTAKLPVPIPPEEEVVYYVNSDGRLIPLRAERYSIVGGGTEQTSHARRTLLRIFGAKSPLRLSSGDVTIAFKLCKKSFANDFAENTCAVSDVVFERWESVQGAREAEIAPRRRAAQRDPDPGQFDVVTTQIGDRAYTMKPAEPLIPGEYCASFSAGDLKLYCFGVDAAR